LNKNTLFISLDHENNIGLKEFTYSYKPNFSMGVKPELSIAPTQFRLYQNYPNPFNSSTQIRFSLTTAQGMTRVVVNVFNILGQKIRNLLDKSLAPGEYELSWDGRNQSAMEMGSGVYFISLETPYYRETIKALLIK